MFAHRLREKVCDWLSSMSVKLTLSLKISDPWPHLLTKHTKLSGGPAHKTNPNLTNATVVKSQLLEDQAKINRHVICIEQPIV